MERNPLYGCLVYHVEWYDDPNPTNKTRVITCEWVTNATVMGKTIELGRAQNWVTRTLLTKREVWEEGATLRVTEPKYMTNSAALGFATNVVFTNFGLTNVLFFVP